ncbi:YihY/virulence factor BrkB family protein [Roseibium sp. RKSG952]|uniref:YihY/virulence factor BrkB family protein n=1 Tax=Roseibium sp. RKSG952 TaxID=2529384 RepID=UPI0012BBE701|nr:YihY/virulence factor BrkB family protein [Roseibium sp. RKSG952]MTH99272.1 YihY/virulence factor BrkB family protein [Roseibium sp. RKSG952]
MSRRGIFVATFQVLKDALGHFGRDDGFAMASHVALSALLAVFPLLIFIAALAGFLGVGEAADRASDLVFDTWPQNIAKPVVDQIHAVLTERRPGLLTFGVIAAVWFASNGVEALRTALNRAYRQREMRSIFLLRLQSIVLVIVGSLILIAYTFLVVLAPLALAMLQRYFPAVSDVLVSIDIIRFGVAGSLLVFGLFATHWLLPSGQRRFLDLLPGVAATLVLWMIAGVSFGAYLASFANYVTTYGGLAGVMTAIVFLYICSAAFILGGELNAALLRVRSIRKKARAEAVKDGRSGAPADYQD